MAAKKKKAAAKKPARRAAAPRKAPAKKKAASASGRGTSKASGRESKEDVVYSDVLHELRSSLVSRLIR